MGLARKLAGRITAMRYEDLPEEAIHWAKIGMLDTVGVALAGSREDTMGMVERVTGAGAGPGPCVIFGGDRRAGPLDAALINGTASHALDFDDCNNTMGGHPSAPMVPALIALGETLDVNGEEFILAYVAGFETETKIALGVNFHHYEKGWHPTATLGTFGSAAACAKLLGLSVAKTETALAIAVSSTLIVVATRADAARLAHAHELQTQVAARTSDLERANARLRALQEQMLRAERLQTEEELVGSVAHAIYNPLAALIGHAELASTDRPHDPQAATVLRLARRVEDVVDRTLQLYRKGSLELRELDPRSLLADAAGMMQVSAAGKQVRVVVRAADSAPRIRGDRALLVEALASLARNSLDAMPNGGELHFSVHSEIRPERTGARGAVVFEVTDTGSGIPAEIAQQIYEPFFTTKPAGTGLGLSIVRGIVKGHRGTLDVRSRTPCGTRARITIPTEP